MKQNALTIHAEESLDAALEELTTNRVSWAPVVEAKTLAQDRQIIGVISIPQMVQLYRKTLAKASHRMQGLAEETAM
jgi:CBS domain-containing protein